MSNPEDTALRLIGRLDQLCCEAEQQRDSALAELAQHDCAEALGVREAIKTLERERDEARAEAERLDHACDSEMRERKRLQAEVERLRAAPPAYLTDIEAAVRLLTATDGSLNAMKLTPDGLRYTLRACTRPIDREGLARALETMPIAQGADWWDDAADAVLRHLGAQAAQPGPLFRWERDVDGDPIVPAPKPLAKERPDPMPLCPACGTRKCSVPQAEPKPPEPAKVSGTIAWVEPQRVRVKLPRPLSEDYSAGGYQAVLEYYEFTRETLREQGVEVEDA